jgi:hypothetical protein
MREKVQDVKSQALEETRLLLFAATIENQQLAAAKLTAQSDYQTRYYIVV